jgi:thiosulfate/3-mercaptopyruvate sulfurtransferase
LAVSNRLQKNAYLNPEILYDPRVNQPEPEQQFQLVGPEFVSEFLAAHNPVNTGVLLEAHFTSIDHPYDADPANMRHIPGAILVHPSYLEAGSNAAKYYPRYECPADGNLLPDAELVSVVSRLGINPDTMVVVYGSEPEGIMAAARLVWGLMYVGVKNIKLLDGGFDAWLKFGGDTVSHITQTSDLAAPRNGHALNASDWPIQHALVATTAEVRAASENPGTTGSKLIDVRRLGEWDGSLTEFYPFFSKAGHIPHAIYQGDWHTLLDKQTQKLRPALETVAQRWRDRDIIDADVQAGTTVLIFYCGTGWRSSISFLVAQLLGLGAKNYDDGFYGWSWNEENDITTE